MARQIKDSTITRKNILQAAEDQFADKGFYGARIDEIAKQANINKRMIYEYFENKENLYKRVLFNVYSRMKKVEARLLKKDYDGVELIREIISSYFDFLSSNPTFVQIIMWENLNKASYLNELPDSILHRSTLQVFTDKIIEGQEKGVFRKEVDAKQTVLSLIVVCFANFSNQYTLSLLFEKNLAQQDIMNLRKQHTIEIVLAYMCA